MADQFFWLLYDHLEKKWYDKYCKQEFEEWDYFLIQSQQLNYLFLSYDSPQSFTEKEVYELLMKEKLKPKSKEHEESLRPIKKKLRLKLEDDSDYMDTINQAGQTDYIKNLKCFLDYFEEKESLEDLIKEIDYNSDKKIDRSELLKYFKSVSVDGLAGKQIIEQIDYLMIPDKWIVVTQDETNEYEDEKTAQVQFKCYKKERTPAVIYDPNLIQVDAYGSLSDTQYT